MKTQKILTVFFLAVLTGCSPVSPQYTPTPEIMSTATITVTPSPTPVPEIKAVIINKTVLFPCSQEDGLSPTTLVEGKEIILRGKYEELGVVSEFDGEKINCGFIPLRDLETESTQLTEVNADAFPNVDYGDALTEIDSKNAQHLKEILNYGNGTIEKLAFSPDGKYLVVASPFRVHLYDGNTYEFVRVIETTPKFLDFSKDGNSLYTVESVSEDNPSVYVWELSSGELKDTIRLSAPALRSFSVSTDGSKFLTTGNGGVILWDASTGRKVKQITSDADSRVAIYSPDGAYIVVGSLGTLTLFNSNGQTQWESQFTDKRGNPDRSSTTVPANINHIAFSPDLSTVIVHGGLSENDVSHHISYLVADGSQAKGHIYYPFAYFSNTLSASNLCSVVCVRVFDLEQQKVVASFGTLDDIWDEDVTWEKPTGEIIDLIFSPDGKFVVTATADGSVQVWELETIKIKTIIYDFSRRVVDVDISSDGNTVSYSDTDWTDRSGYDNGIRISLQEVWGGTIKILPEDVYGWVFDIKFFPNQPILATSVYDENWKKQKVHVYTWDTGTAEILETYTRSSLSGGEVHISLDASALVANMGPETNRVYVWEVGEPENPIMERKVSFPSTSLNSAISSDGSILVFEDIITTGEWHTEIMAANVVERMKLDTNIPNYRAASFDFIPQNDNLAILAFDNNWQAEIQVWNTEEWKKIKSKRVPGASVFADIALSPNGQLLALTTWDNVIQIYRIDGDINLMTTLSGHVKKITAISFSGDGRFLISGSDDGTIKIWGVAP
ncbi:MAG: hypothetical protein HS100_00135 [Anaerolineales bacterium]|nr:hypothetical protein [Anaerolineales bacterium]